MPPIWQLPLDSLHPLSIALRNRLGVADRRLLSRALHVSPRTFPDVPFLLRPKTTPTSARKYSTRSQENNDSAGAVESLPSECAGATSSDRPWRLEPSSRGIDPGEGGEDLPQFELSQGRRISRLTRLDKALAKIAERGPRASPTAGNYSERRRRLTGARSDTESPHEIETPGTTENLSQIIEKEAPISFQQPVEQGTSADGKRDMYPWSAELPKEVSKGQSPAESTEKQDWSGISYFEAMQNLDIDQRPATTEGPVVPDVTAKTLALRQSTCNEEEFQEESILARRRQVPEHPGGQEAAQASENHGQYLEVEEVEQQDQPLQLRSEHTTTAESQGGLLASLFPEMSSEPETDDRNVEEQKDSPENQGGLVAALFPDMAAENDPNELLDMLFPELRPKQSEADHVVRVQRPSNKTSLKSKEKSGSGAESFDWSYSTETCGQNEQLPQATLQHKSTTMTPGQMSTEKAITVDPKPGNGLRDRKRTLPVDSRTTKEPLDRDLNYHDVAPENLLEELFPEESKKRSKKDLARQQKVVIPKMRLDLAAGPRMRHYIGSGEIRNPRQNQTCIVTLQAVSPRLTEEDIRGLLPPSTHIEGWSSEYIKTIPIRDPITLDRKDAYYILFRSPRGAFHFQERLRNLHDILFKLAPTSMLSPRTHPLSLTDWDTGEDFSASLKLYTLGPPTQRGNIYARVLREPWPHEVARLVHNGGYPQVIDRAPGIAAKVLLHFDGMQPTKYEIVDAIRADGHDRGVPWDIPGGYNGGPTVVAGVMQLSTVRRGDAYADTSALMRRLAPRWLISFRSKAEAHRFVRRWHRRPFPWQPKEYAEYGEDMPKVRAEVLW